MPLTPDQLDNWFTYHAPTDETAPKYAAIRHAESAVVFDITQTSYEGVTCAVLHTRINAVTRHFAETIDALAPDSADKSAAIRCVRLARNFFNEWAVESQKPAGDRSWADPVVLFDRAVFELTRARFQANSAIACGGR